ncbi:cysteine peptidase family C39 domain-containing protein [Xylanibacter rarus]
MKNFKLYRQHDAMQCGTACLRMICSHYGAGQTGIIASFP